MRKEEPSVSDFLQAVDEGDLVNAELLLLAGADANMQNGKPLSWAMRNNNLPMIKLLVERGGNLSCLYSADIEGVVVDGNVEAARFLFAHIQAPYSDKKDHLIKLAVRYGQLPMMQFLVELGASVEVGLAELERIQGYDLVRYAKARDWLKGVQHCRMEKEVLEGGLGECVSPIESTITQVQQKKRM